MERPFFKVIVIMIQSSKFSKPLIERSRRKLLREIANSSVLLDSRGQTQFRTY